MGEFTYLYAISHGMVHFSDPVRKRGYKKTIVPYVCFMLNWPYFNFGIGNRISTFVSDLSFVAYLGPLYTSPG